MLNVSDAAIKAIKEAIAGMVPTGDMPKMDAVRIVLQGFG